MRIAIVGGTGWVGRHVVAVARARRHEPVVVARSTGADLLTGQGLVGALTGCTAVIDVSNVKTTSGRKASAFFEASSQNLLAAGADAGVSHHVVLSIVGVDRVDLGYYQGKLRQEELALTSGRPVTVLRATQFHEFAAQMLEAGRALGPTPKLLSQPIAAVEVAEALVAHAEGPISGLAPDIAGPRHEQMVDMVRRLVAARGRRTRVIPVKIPVAAGRAILGGGLLPLTDGPRGAITYDEWLAQEVAGEHARG